MLKYVVPRISKFFRKRPLQEPLKKIKPDLMVISSAINKISLLKSLKKEWVFEIEQQIVDSNLSNREKNIFRERLRNAVAKSRKLKWFYLNGLIVFIPSNSPKSFSFSVIIFVILFLIMVAIIKAS